MPKRIQISSHDRILKLSWGRDVGKNERVEEQESLQTAGSQQGTDVTARYDLRL